jgi:hypothetical protein
MTEQNKKIKLLHYTSTGDHKHLLALNACYEFLTFILGSSGNKK